MDEQQIITKPSKFDRSNLISRTYVLWIYTTFFKGLRKTITFDDIYRCPDDDDCQQLVAKFERHWANELDSSRQSTPSFLRANIKTFIMKMFVPFCLIGFSECVLKLVQPVLLGYVIRYFAQPDKQDYQTACLYAGGVVLIGLVNTMVYHPAAVIGCRVATKIRVTWCTLIYKKALKLKPSAFGKTTSGQILNLMTSDVSRFDEFCSIGSYIIIGPIQTCLAIYICYLYIGWPCFIGLAILLLFIPYNSFMGRLFLKIRSQTASLTDNRIRLMNEIIKGMAVIKMYAWEQHFAKLIGDARKKEMSKIRQSIFLKGLNFSISTVSARVVQFAVFIVYALLGNQLQAELVFVTIQLLTTIRYPITWWFAQSVALVAEINVSCGRVQNFLLLDEIDDNNHDDKSIINNDDNNNNNFENTNQLNDKLINIMVNNMSAKWLPDSDVCTLENISLTVKPGELLAVIGPVGSGKSSFLMSLMNEISVTSGTVRVNGSIAYASQESWSFNASIIQNITFGLPFDSRKWREVISVCAMNTDLKLFPFGEKTLVGERGVSLSGGQKARLTLARALYNDADIYLLDDPLSAVDSEVAKHIFEKCITEYLKHKTVVLVTHQIQFIRKATKILVIHEGRPLGFGSYNDLIDSGIDFMSLLTKDDDNEVSVDQTIDDTNDQTMKIIIDDEEEEEEDISTKKLSISSSSLSSDEPEMDSKIIDTTIEPKLTDESKQSGSVSGTVYWQYIRSGSGPVLFILAILSTLVSQMLFHYSDIWLSQWTNSEDSRPNHTSDDKTNDNIIMFSVLTIVTFGTLLIRSLTFFMMCMKASVRLHNKIFYQLIRSPISFFDNNPVGRILNRFTKDVGIVDEQLPFCAYDLNIHVSLILGSIIVVAIVNWYLLFPALAMCLVIVQIRRMYIRAARDLKRCESIARSPMYTHMSTTLNGLATIRSFKVQSMFLKQYYRYQNDHTATYTMCFSGARALGILMDNLCVVYLFFVALFLMIFHQGLAGGAAGLALTMALGLTRVTQWCVRQSAEVENQMTSVERILEYSRLESEAELDSLKKPPDDWPQRGTIEFKDVSLTYDNSPKPTLMGLNFSINGGDKVGIVGRTGAGKSSILSALFRMHECDGQILIDGIDSKSLGLHDLRKHISIIPQEPVAFIGTLRKNLDPFDEHSEDRLWDALKQVQLRDAVMEMPGHLDYQLSESGGNLSVGQRQLICLARAILRRNRILVLDEATANVDHNTDSLIQQTIRQNFADCTVITIAHRLNTIIDSNKVLVLDSGRVQQFDSPYRLLQNNCGLFYKLVKQTGPQMAGQLISSAKQAYDRMTD